MAWLGTTNKQEVMMMKSILLIVVLLALVGCTSDRSLVRPLCRHHAFSCAAAAHEEGKEAHLSFGPVHRNGQTEWNNWHAQTYIVVKGEKKWLQMRDSGHCDEGKQDYFIPKKTYNMREYLLYLLSK
jgi:hypothetical protein